MEDLSRELKQKLQRASGDPEEKAASKVIRKKVDPNFLETRSKRIKIEDD